MRFDKCESESNRCDCFGYFVLLAQVSLVLSILRPWFHSVIASIYDFGKMRLLLISEGSSPLPFPTMLVEFAIKLIEFALKLIEFALKLGLARL